MEEQELKEIVKKEIYTYIQKESVSIIQHFFINLTIEETLKAINFKHSCTELKSKKCPMCNEEKDCEGHNVCEDCGGRSF